MFTNQIETALSVASLKQIDAIMKAVWSAYGSGSITETDAEQIATQAEVRRVLIRGAGAVAVRTGPAGASIQSASALDQRPPLPRHLFPARRRQRAPDRAKSIARRRTLATAGVMPPALAARFTTGEMAALAIIASEAGCTRQCDCSIAEIAARAGVARTTVQNAVRRAQDLGLIVMTERRRPGRASDTNLIRITSAEWKQWMMRGSRRPGTGVAQAERVLFKDHGGFKKTDCTGNPTGIRKGRSIKIRSKRPSGPPKAVA